MIPMIAFDVETPNARNDRISAIGITLIENGEITRSFGVPVDPETHFDAFNIALTGITPESVRGKMNFPALWERIGPAFTENLLLAHNAPFDMRVLAKCLQHYEIDFPETLSYACTCNMARRFYPHLSHHGLADMCELFGITLDHHKADSDALACAKLALKYADYGKDLTPFFRRYDIERMKTLPYRAERPCPPPPAKETEL